MRLEPMRRLTLSEAADLHGRVAGTRVPGTLHPSYVEADACRDPRLEPLHLGYQSSGRVWMHSLHQSTIPGTGWKDASSPYGYGGPVANTDDPDFLREAWTAYEAWMRANRVVVEYVRFHPLMANERLYGGRVADNREVVSIDLVSGDATSAYPSRLRQTLKKAERAGLCYAEYPLAARCEAFAQYYRTAMRGIGADPFYLFEDTYFRALAATGMGRVGVCGAEAGADAPQWLAACLFIDAPGVREYHLAATSEAGRAHGASAFALHQGAMAARQRGAMSMYLGGGTDARRDNPLLFFKGGFSPLRLVYRTGFSVFDASGYEEIKTRFAAEWQAHPERPIFYRKV